MGLKKNNPGCNCCEGRILIWNIGRRNLNPFSVGSPLAVSDIDVTLWATAAVAEGKEIDYAIGSPILEDAFYGVFTGGVSAGCVTSWDFANKFDADTDGVTLEYWSGDVNDYELIVWIDPMPAPLVQGYWDYTAANCGDSGPSCVGQKEDAGFINGGEPSWFDSVFTGSWSGKLVFGSGSWRVGNGTQTSFSVVQDGSGAFINNYSGITGITSEPTVKRNDNDHFLPDADTRTAASTGISDITTGVPTLRLSSPPSFTLSTGENVFNEVLYTCTTDYYDFCSWHGADLLNPVSPFTQTSNVGVRSGAVKGDLEDPSGIVDFYAFDPYMLGFDFFEVGSDPFFDAKVQLARNIISAAALTLEDFGLA